MSKIIDYPMRFVDGKLAFAEQDEVQMDVLLDCPPRSRLFDRDYGLNVKFLQQKTLSLERAIPVALIEIKTKFRRYLRNINLLQARLFKLKAKPRTLYIEIAFKNEVTTNLKTVELNDI